MRYLAVILFLVALSGFADRLELKDGTVLMGSVEQKLQGKFTISNPMYGKVSVSEGDVMFMQIDHPMNVIDKEKRIVTGKVSTTSEVGAIMVDGYSRVYTQPEIVAMWNVGTPDITQPPPPKPPQARKWKGEIFADMTARTGKTKKLRHASGVRFDCTGPIDRFSASASMVYEQEDGNTSTNEYNGVLDYERQLSGRGSWYVKSEFEQDKIDQIELRWKGVVGGGYHLVMRPDMIVRLRCGFGYQIKRFYNEIKEENNPNGELNFHFEKKFKGIGSFVSDVTYTPKWEENRSYTLIHESSFDIPMFVRLPLTLRLGIRNEYDSSRVGDDKKLDTIYFARLVYRW